MKSFIKYASVLSLAVMAAPLSAKSPETISVQPGQWTYEYSYEFGGQVVDSESETYCLTEDESRRTLDSLIADVKDDGNCEISNLIHTDNKISADAVCVIKELGMEADGTISANYSETRYDVVAKAVIDMGRLQLPATANASAQRIGDCAPE